MYKYSLLPDGVSILEAAEYWRGQKGGFDVFDPDLRRDLNRQVVQEYDDLYLKYNPEYWDDRMIQFGRRAMGSSARPSEETWQEKERAYHEAMYEIDHWSAVPGGEPAYTGHVLTEDTRESIPGYLEFEAAQDRVLAYKRVEMYYPGRLSGLDVTRKSTFVPEQERGLDKTAQQTKTRPSYVRDVSDMFLVSEEETEAQVSKEEMGGE